MKAPLATAVAIALGLIVLLGYFLPVPLLQNLRDLFLGWAIILAGVAALVGILNLVRVHWRKATTRAERDPYSPLLIFAFIVTILAGFILGGPADPVFQQVVNAVQVPVESSLMAVLALALAYASLRLLQRRRGLAGIVFALSAALFLVLNSGIPAAVDMPFLQVLLGGLQRLPVAGARGILLGIALGSLTTGLRVLFGVDRPYSG